MIQTESDTTRYSDVTASLVTEELHILHCQPDLLDP